jgi:hypothetical protein
MWICPTPCRSNLQSLRFRKSKISAYDT